VKAAGLDQADLDRIAFTTSAGPHGGPLAEFAVFGVLSAFWTLIALGLALKMLGGYVISFAQTVPGMIVLGLLAVLLIYRWGSRRMRRRLAARRKQAAAQGA